MECEVNVGDIPLEISASPAIKVCRREAIVKRVLI